MIKSAKNSLLSTFLNRASKLSPVTQTKCKSYEDIPGPLQLPVIGSSWKFLPFIGEFDKENQIVSSQILYKRYGPIVRQKFGSVDLVHLFDPNDFETIHKLCHKTKHLRLSFNALKEFRESRPHIYKTNGMLSSQGEEWWNVRRISQKPVSPRKAVKTYISQEDAIVKEFIEKLDQMGSVKDYLSFGNRLNLDLTLMYLFGERKHCFDHPQTLPESTESKILNYATNFLDTITYFDQSLFYISFPSTHEKELLFKNLLTVEKYTQDMIEQVKSRNDPGDRCVVAQLMRNPEVKSLDFASIVDLLYTGIDTTSTISSSILHELGMNKQVQDKVREEARRLLPKGRNSEITVETLSQASYLKAVIKENFRLNPIVAFQNRQLTESVELSKYHVPKDTMVLMETYTACRLEKNFKNPLEFKPERWLKSSDEYEESHPYIMLQFGLGIRSCIARRRAEQILHLILLRIMSEFEVSHSGEQIKRYTPFLLKPSEPLNLTFTKK